MDQQGKRLKQEPGGFFRMPEEESRALLQNLRSVTPRAHEGEVLAYLRSGRPLFAVPGIVMDILGESGVIIGPPQISTDGAWAWTADVLYYIERYHIAVPPELLNRMREHNWKCPEVLNPQDLQLNDCHSD